MSNGLSHAPPRGSGGSCNGCWRKTATQAGSTPLTGAIEAPSISFPVCRRASSAALGQLATCQPHETSMTQTIELFPQAAFEPVEKKIERAAAVVVGLFRAGHPLFLAFSGGKDSRSESIQSGPPWPCIMPVTSRRL